MLLIKPGLANVRLELGLLYLRAGSNDLAVFNLEAALAAPGITPEARRNPA
jgi:Tfp pilus assembly protein PilF